MVNARASCLLHVLAPADASLQTYNFITMFEAHIHFCICPSSHCCDKIPNESKLKKEGRVLFAHSLRAQSITVGKS